MKGTFEYIIKNYDRVLELTWSSLSLIAIAITLAILLWSAVGIAIRDNERIAMGTIGVASFFMSIPSLSLYGLLVAIPGFGLSRTSAVTGLLVYAMLPIVRNIYVALNNVDAEVLEAARGMGMNRKQVFRKVQLPLAIPIVFAGVRVALVMMVGISTLAVYIGERNLGILISQGITRTDLAMIGTGALCISVLAIGVDLIMGAIQKRLVPKGLKVDRGGAGA